MTTPDPRPLVLITGAAGNLGQTLALSLGDSYRVVGLDRKARPTPFPILQADFASAASIELALHKLRDAFGARIASVVHLVAYFDFNRIEEKPDLENELGTNCYFTPMVKEALKL